MQYEKSEVMRVIDANLNRAAEGLRTLEDMARLVYQDSASAYWLKRLRHSFAEAAAGFDRGDRLAARSTQADVGTDHSTSSERGRDDWMDITAAATERIGQSLRCLEEAAKLAHQPASAAFKQLRYEAYDVLAKVELRWRDGGCGAARLYLLIDCSRPLEDLLRYVRQLAAAGVDLFQLRDKQADGRTLMQYARAMVEALSSSDSALIINDRADIAVASGAAGVHVGQEDMSLAAVKSAVSARLWVGVSTHDMAQAETAQAEGADYIGCGPTFPSKTKQFTEFAGTAFLQQVGQAIEIPAFAIGGIDLSNIQKVISSGCTRVAVSSVIHDAEDPAAVAHELSVALKTA